MARGWHLVARPAGMPVASDFALRDLADAPLADGAVRVRNIWLSVDPYMRGRMNDVKSYAPPFALDAPMQGGAVGEVIESRSDALPVGAKVIHMLGWRDEAVGPAAAFRALPDHGAPDRLFLSTLGMPGMTAYFGLLATAEAKSGETLFVSAAAGAVGSVVVQIAKQRGLTVIGSAGGPEKCDHVRAIGADHVIDYKAEPSLLKALRRAAPDGIDVYFDNVGGEHLDAALALARDNARFAICGMIEGYNATGVTPMRFLMRIISARIRLRGFIVSDFMDRAAAFERDMGRWVAEGRITTRETVREGLEAMPQTFLDLFAGGNLGKMLVRP